MRQVRLVLLVQVLNSFVTGVLSVVLPLMMRARSIDIVTMGFVFAAMPIVFQLGRMLFATVSDFWGRKPFFLLSGALVAVANGIYYFAFTPLEFLFGKVVEGVKSGSLWAVNRAFLLEKSEKKWRALVNLRTTSYVSSAAGSLLAGFLVVWLLFENTLALCALLGIAAIPLSFMLGGEKRKTLSMSKALHFLDLRKKNQTFKICLALFMVMGLSFGFVSGFVYPLFLSHQGFEAETVGLLFGFQTLLAGLTSYFFAGRFEIRRLIFFSGVLYTLTLILIGSASSMVAGFLVVGYGAIEGLLGIGQEGIVSRITNEASYGTDIGLLWTGHHIGRTFSLALSGIVISTLGFAAPFLISALVYVFFYTAIVFVLKS
jgi:MFS family permease